MLPHDDQHYYLLAQRGMDYGDSNCFVHAQLLLHHLQHRRSLKQHAAILRHEQKILHEARQLERILQTASNKSLQPTAGRRDDQL